MPSYTLIVSNPPHGEVDLHGAAQVLGLIPVEANLKVRYSIPEIWIAEADPAKAETAAGQLREAGANVVTARSEELVAVPSQRLVHGFSFGKNGLAVALKAGNANIPYHHPMIAIHCTPRVPEGGTGGPPWFPEGPSGPSVSDGSTFLDLYLPSKSGIVRLAVYQEVADFTGLGDRKVASQAQNMVRFVQELEKRFTKVRADHRLLNMQLRRRPSAGTPPNVENTRRGFSYASPGFFQLIGAIAPALKGISQSELSSRLAFLTDR